MRYSNCLAFPPQIGGDPTQIVFVRRLRLDVAGDVLIAVPDAEVGVPRFGSLRLGGYVDITPSGRLRVAGEELLEHRIKALLAGVAPLKNIEERLEIIL